MYVYIYTHVVYMYTYVNIAMSGVGLYHLDEESSNETMSPSFLEAVGSLHQPRSPPLLQVWFIHPGYGG